MPEAPTPGTPGDITLLLHASANGDADAFGRLVTLVYAELNALAHRRLRGEDPGHTLGTTGLVHEAYLKLAGQHRAGWENRQQFFAVASEAMRRILVDHARRRHRAKRGDAAAMQPLEAAEHSPSLDLLGDHDPTAILALDQALGQLATFNPEGARVVQLRFFVGLSNAEVAEVMNSSERTVRRVWQVAKAWLRREIGHEGLSD